MIKCVYGLRVCKNLRYLKKAKGLTRRRLAGIMDVNVKTLDSYIGDRATPPFPALILACSYFGYPLDIIVKIDLAEKDFSGARA